MKIFEQRVFKIKFKNIKKEKKYKIRNKFLFNIFNNQIKIYEIWYWYKWIYKKNYVFKNFFIYIILLKVVLTI